MRVTIVQIIIVAFLFIGINVNAQQYSCGESAGQPYLVTAGSGLSMRVEPGLTSVKLQAIPYGKEVMVCPEYQGYSATVEGIEGVWLKVFYNGQSGFMFSGFMQALPPVEVIIPDEWTGEEYQADRNFYGVYLNEEDKYFGDQTFDIRKIDFQVDTVEVPEIPPYYYTHLKSDDTPDFMFSGLEPEHKHGIPGKKFNRKFLYPGESVSVTTDNAHFHIYAKGRILESKSVEEINPIAMIKNYELHVRRTTNDGDFEDQIIYKMDIAGWFSEGYEGGVFLQWIGDLDNDGELDMLLNTATGYSCWDTVFFLSSKAERGHFFKQVTKYEQCDGC